MSGRRFTLPPLKRKKEEHLQVKVERLINSCLWAIEHASSDQFKVQYTKNLEELVQLYEKLEKRGWSGKVFDEFYVRGFKDSSYL